ncbi:MAG: exosortase/archaeosortase family protein [Planctomycetota bacterium]|jgi:exosortase
MIERRSWRFTDGVLLMGLGALAILAAWPVWYAIFERGWKDVEQSHVFLAPFVIGLLIWVRRERVRLCRPCWSFLGPVVILVGWGLTWVGFRREWELFEHAGAAGMLVGAVLTVVGPQCMRKYAPALGAVVFLFPVPGRIRVRIAGPLENISAQITEFGLDLIAIPISRAGNTLTVNNIEVQIAEACNGMRMVAALALVTYAFVFSVPMRNSVRFGILAISPLIALVVNVIRLIPTVLFYGYSTSEVADTFHDISGWLMLGVALALLWGLLQILRWIEVPVTSYAVVEDHS